MPSVQEGESYWSPSTGPSRNLPCWTFSGVTRTPWPPPVSQLAMAREMSAKPMSRRTVSLNLGKNEDLIPVLPHNDQLMPTIYFARAVNKGAEITGA